MKTLAIFCALSIFAVANVKAEEAAKQAAPVAVEETKAPKAEKKHHKHAGSKHKEEKTEAHAA